MFEIVIPFEDCQSDVKKYLIKKKMLPLRMKALEGPIDAVAEAMSLGFLIIGDGDVITHTLIEPVKDSTGAVSLDKLTYKARLSPADVNKKISELKVLTQATQTAAISSMLTDQPVGILNKMEPQDRNICDCISLFFI